MSATTLAPHRPDAALTERSTSADIESRLAAAVREGVVRATVGAGLAGVASVHVVDAVGKWDETRYIFWMYMAAIVAAVILAGAVIFTRSRTALAGAVALSASVLGGYILSRTTGLPSASDDVGNWTEALGLTSMVIEIATLAVAVGGLAFMGMPSRDSR